MTTGLSAQREPIVSDSGWATGWRGDAAMLGAGALSAAALPPVHVIPVLLASMPMLLIAIGRARTPSVALRRGWWFGFGHHLLGLYWITEAILYVADRLWWAVPLAVPALAALLAVFIAVPCMAARAARAGPPRALVLAGAWVFGDLARQFFATGFPWDPIGCVWTIPGAVGDVFIQPAAWIGVHGLTWLTLILAMTPAIGRRAIVGGTLLLALWAGAGLWRLSAPADDAPPGVDVALVQGDIAQDMKFDRARARRAFETYLDLTRNAADRLRARAPGRRTVIVWPETASPFLLTADPQARAAIAEAADGTTVLAGTVRLDAQGRPRNSMVAIAPDGALAGEYDKWHLVPFGEFQPDWFPLPFQVVPGGGFAAGDGPRTLSLAGLPDVGPLICYEAIYSGEMVDPVRRPAWLVNITNDAWFGNSSGPRQHLAAARLRAVEEGVPLVRAANTGITAAFDAHGRELARLPMKIAGVLYIDLPNRLPETLYASYGLASAALIGIFSIVFGAALTLRLHKS